MEMRYKLMSSNDPRIIYKYIYSFSGYCYYANHYDRIIRDGIFLTGSRSLNGFGQIIDYKNNIIIKTGEFKNDKPIGSYQLIETYQPFYKGKKINTNRLEYYCDAVQKNILYDETNCKYFDSNESDKSDIFLRLVVDNGKLLECSITNIPTWHEKSKFSVVEFKQIFNDKWKHD